MYSWTTIRTAAAVLLLIPIVHLVYLVSRETIATLDESPEVWADEVAAYSRLDQRGKLPKDPVVIVGGRRVSLWRDLEDVLAPMAVLNRAIGDGTTNDIRYYYQRLIGFYRPHSVVLLPGESEFHIRESKSAGEMVQAIRQLVEMDLSHGITQHFYVISPLKTPLYRSNNYKIDETTRLLKAWAGPLDDVEIIDANTLLSDRDGNAKPAYYRSDGVHLNEHGYVRLSIMLRAQFEKDNPGIYTPDTAS
jgi:lysophospholipase L1-like esterase